MHGYAQFLKFKKYILDIFKIKGVYFPFNHVVTRYFLRHPLTYLESFGSRQ